MTPLIPCTIPLRLSGERFRVRYRIVGHESQARARARDICLEQTVEFPEDLLPEGPIREEVVGHLEALEEVEDQSCLAVLSYPVEAAGDDLSQLVNVILGNTSLKPGIRAEVVELAPAQEQAFRGPRFGAPGLREIVGVPDRPLLATALKPMGLAPVDLAEMAYRFALAGIDLIKDDHGLTNQKFCPFEERLTRCADAVARANRQTGQKCLYVPNVTAAPEECVRRARRAREAGAGGLLVCPGLTGLETMRCLADHDEVALPILSHPAFQGSLVVNPASGLSHGLIFGQLARLAGADVSIFPNYGGRFSFKREECLDLAEGTAMAMGSLRPIFPAPAGGLSLERVSDLEDAYGREVIILVGGGLFQHGPDLMENCRLLRQRAAKFQGRASTSCST